MQDQQRPLVQSKSILECNRIAPEKNSRAMFALQHFIPEHCTLNRIIPNRTSATAHLRWLYIVICKSLQLRGYFCLCKYFSCNTWSNIYNQVSVALIYLRKILSVPYCRCYGNQRQRYLACFLTQAYFNTDFLGFYTVNFPCFWRNEVNT